VLVPPRQFEELDAPRFDPTSQRVIFSAAPLGLIPTNLSLFRIASLGAAHGAPKDLFSMPVAGGQWTRVATIGADDPVSAWSPDGSRLAVLSGEALRTIGLDGSPERPLIQPGSYGSVDWARRSCSLPPN